MNLPRSTYYYKAHNNLGDDQALIGQIEAVIEQFPKYGYRRVTHALQRQGIPVNHKKTLRLMRQRGLLLKPKRRWIRTTDSTHLYRIYPNLLQHQRVTAPNEVWAADITFIAIQSGYIYLAAILDLFSRKVIGYAISSRIDTALCRQALEMAIKTRGLTEGIIHHSDRGVQYASHDYVDTLLAHGFKISMARKANPYDNATIESFFKTLKVEEVYLWEYPSLEEVQDRLPYFIEEVYNRKRLHSSLGYRPPVEYEELFFKTKRASPLP
jgi:transposase InsO family protein